MTRFLKIGDLIWIESVEQWNISLASEGSRTVIYIVDNDESWRFHGNYPNVLWKE